MGHRIEVFTDHKNLTYKQFNTERVMRWRLLIEEFGLQLTYIKGERNIVADFLSRMDLKPEEFSLDAFAGDPAVDFPADYPLSHGETQHRQQEDEDLQRPITDSPQNYGQQRYCHSDKDHTLITKGDKIVLPESLQVRATEWHHTHLLHPGETRMEITMGQHYCWIGMRRTIQSVCGACNICKRQKAKNKNFGHPPPKPTPEIIPWHTPCIDLMGPYKFGEGKHQAVSHALTMIDPATGWFEIAETDEKSADEVVNCLKFT